MKERREEVTAKKKSVAVFYRTIFLFCYALHQKELQIECRVIIQ